MNENVRFKDDIVASIINVTGPDKIVDWGKFVDDIEHIIIANYDGGSIKVYKGDWKNRVKTVVKLMGCTLGQYNEEIFPSLEETPKKKGKSSSNDAKTATSNPTSSLQYQRKLDENDLIALEERHGKLKKKWKLKTGRVVEDVIYDEAKHFNYDHPYHSNIITIDDDKLSKLFTKEEVEEITAASGKELFSASFPDHLEAIIKNLEKKASFKEIEEVFMDLKFSRIRNPEEHWLTKSVLEYIEMFYESNTARTFHSEATLFDEMYSFVKDSKKICNTVTDFTSGSASSNESKNMNRSIGSNDKVARQIPGDIPDLSFVYLNNELGCVEIGLHDNGANSTKEMNERVIKTPKMMRNYCWKIINEYHVQPTNIKIISYVISGPHITSSIMTFKHGSVGLICSSPRLKMPTNIRELPRLFPRVLKLCYNIAKVIKSNVDYLDETCGEAETDDLNELYFPPSFEPVGTTSANKKRKSFSTSSDL